MFCRKSIVLAVSSLACASASLAPSYRGNQRSVSAFVSPPLHALRGSNGLSSTEMSESARPGIQGFTMMASRRNLKKEKRARNLVYARQFKKTTPGYGPRPRPGSSRAEQESNDSEWLAQIYGQHSIYKREVETTSFIACAKSENDASRTTSGKDDQAKPSDKVLVEA